MTSVLTFELDHLIQLPSGLASPQLISNLIPFSDIGLSSRYFPGLSEPKFKLSFSLVCLQFLQHFSRRYWLLFLVQAPRIDKAVLQYIQLELGHIVHLLVP